jgi:hypothetical protein
VKPEYADVVKAAAEVGLPAAEVARLAERAAETILEEKGYNWCQAARLKRDRAGLIRTKKNRGEKYE